jgi:hypothetical protein
LGEDEEFRARIDVLEGHIYAVEVSVGQDGGFPGFESSSTQVRISGDPLDADLQIPLSTGFGFLDVGGVFGDGGPTDFFIAERDGQIAIEFVNNSSGGLGFGGPVGDVFGGLLFGESTLDYEILIVDQGFDDNGTSPEDAVILNTGSAEELLGTLIVGDEADYFTISVEKGKTYELRIESTASVTVDSGSTDRFGQINFGVATAGGLSLFGNAAPGSVGTTIFVAPGTEELVLRLRAGGFGAGEVQYAISLTLDGEDDVASQTVGGVVVNP